MIPRRVTVPQLILGLSGFAVIAACVIRYLSFPSFWLDEAFVAVSLRSPTPRSIFAPLAYSQSFPRIYLSAIAALRDLFGYRIWVLRLLPSLSFVAATVLWARLLAKRVGRYSGLAMLGGVLLLGSSFWLDQAIQLKQYTLDVLLALIPFSIGDDFYTEGLADDKHRYKIALLTLPCVVSYTYPIALVARVVGWYADRIRREGWRLNAVGVLALVAPLATGLAGIWLTDHQFNIQSRAALLGYWNDSILSTRFKRGAGSGVGLLANFIWGWHHGRLMPLVIAAVAPLQVLGIWRVFDRWKNRRADPDDGWGSRTLGSLTLLTLVVLASAFASYPIAAGRLVLFTQVHTQIIAIEGMLFLQGWRVARRIAAVAVIAIIGVVTVYSVHRYIDFIRTEPIENINPMLPLIKPELADEVLVHPCSVAQVESLPAPLPVERVVFERKNQLPQSGDRAWILWTNLSDDYCRDWLSEVRSRARTWQLIHEGPGRGLALAEF